MKCGLEIQQSLLKKEIIKNMENIAIFIPTIGSGGAEKQATLLAEILSHSFQVHFIVYYGDLNASASNLQRLQVPKIAMHFLKGGHFKKIAEFHEILKSNNIQTVFNYLTFCDFVGSIVEKITGVKRIYNGIRNSELPRSKCMMEKIVHNTIVTGTIFNCNSGAKAFSRKGFDVQKNIVIPNCYSPISEECVRTEKLVKRIITVGRFVEQKDYFTALNVIAELKKVRQDFAFDIVGYGHLEYQIRDWIKQLAIEDVVSIHINPKNIPELLMNADIYLSTSLFEGTSNSIMEAMNYSLPVVATNVGDNYCLIDNTVTGFLNDIADVQGLASSIQRLLDNYKLRVDMGIRANRKLSVYYSKSTFTEKYLNLLQ